MHLRGTFFFPQALGKRPRRSRVIPTREPAQRADEGPCRQSSWSVGAGLDFDPGGLVLRNAEGSESSDHAENGKSNLFISLLHRFSSPSFCAVRALCVPPCRLAKRQPPTMTSQHVPPSSRRFPLRLHAALGLIIALLCDESHSPEQRREEWNSVRHNPIQANEFGPRRPNRGGKASGRFSGDSRCSRSSCQVSCASTTSTGD